ncbi:MULTISPECIES: DsbE family thiol:disulfide interchange protein [Methyloversatilis]|jgi:cytochrome c biogenesis protein CcmG, thiol:disulfide interchange protein DsbE|uniref:DsbE family thiol:disulfide interchange protein n=1 Tax=Methyloversatilis TaxID=378210 RepID=UPI00035EF862|nr:MULTISPECIES: DsbE family thiol:disulfide interchange protein [Methyloversatilis]PZU51565.1 MAG: DsbE family thiol:disulfide interchange protein [Thauera sp.]MBC7207444.1 DsbE family thiol:disulfide interchange protein [Methyloversatilis sp.]MBL8469230.1 DsbE family thiol:disulfide interchange protein [Methyloversatilis discipulorum]MBT9518660.1 DsbE family thiol:disulfide interchange protein [Methyloversatilis discipulorum]MCR6666127.1 DsbE family thiol:disulfide interchange protein [Methy
MKRYLWPLGLFLVLAGFLFAGLYLNPREVPSPLIGKAVPAFSIPQLAAPDKTFSPADMKGKVWLVNVWASWCVSCRQEHPLLVELAKTGLVPMVGLHYKDERDAGMKWLAEHGDPYLLSAHDRDGRVAIDFGVYGTPETFIVDKTGVIRYKHTGPLTPQLLRDDILPRVKQLEAS